MIDWIAGHWPLILLGVLVFLLGGAFAAWRIDRMEQEWEEDEHCGGLGL